jgi:hypothetical protein
MLGRTRILKIVSGARIPNMASGFRILKVVRFIDKYSLTGLNRKRLCEVSINVYNSGGYMHPDSSSPTRAVFGFRGCEGCKHVTKP